MAGEKEGSFLPEKVINSGTPVFEFRPRQHLNTDDQKFIADALEAEQVPLITHPEMGSGLGFRLNREPTAGRVTEVDIYLSPSRSKSAAIRLHRLDDFGEPHASRHRFDIGYVLEGSASAVAFQTKHQERIITVFNNGALDEAISQHRRKELISAEEKAMAVLPSIISAHEAARILGVTRTAIFGAIERGRIVADKVAGRWEVNTESLLDYEKSIAHRQGKPGPRSSQAEPDWLTIKEATAVMDISWSYAKKLIEDGKLPAMRRGNIWFIDKEAAGSFERQRKKSPK